MKPASLILLGLASLVAAITPPAHTGPEQSKQPKPSTLEWREAHQALDNLTAWVNQARKTSGQSESGARHAAENLWTEVDRLKREGVNVRAIEYYTADLERSLRPGYEDATARRHIQNNLEYEIDAVRRQMRR